jgi:hypothetical protein
MVTVKLTRCSITLFLIYQVLQNVNQVSNVSTRFTVPQEPSSLPESPRAKPNMKGLLAVLAIACIIMIPVAYSVGQSNGYDSGYRTGNNIGYASGYQTGKNAGYSEGFDDGRESGRFDFYYVKPEQKFGVYDLSDFVTGRKWLKPYQAGVFDCSEMSAALEWTLENEGWHTIIIIGNSPFGSGYHAWLLVETSLGAYMPVESTSMSVVWWENPNFDNYFVYDHSFETIQDALAYSETEFDWWES